MRLGRESGHARPSALHNKNLETRSIKINSKKLETHTCRMGRDSKAVVDSQLKVNGIENLRIVDSSIMPRIASVATMATCVLIGERAADILAPTA